MDEPDPVTGLTLREKREVTESWALLKKDIRMTGEKLFIRFCTKHPEHHARFTAFAKVPTDKLGGNKKLRSHANSVMYVLGAVVDNLEDTSVMVGMMNKLGISHAFKQVPEQGFKDLKGVLLELLQELLGSKISPGGIDAWNKTINVVLAIIFKGMRDTILSGAVASMSAQK